jgi:Pyruvate/2-oxoacid:ferredoxin oxidoreductase delta subunit
MSLVNDALLRYLGRVVKKPDIPETQCLVRRYPAFRCHACRDACPQNAIGQNLKKHYRSCKSCGLCAVSCPVSAIDCGLSVFTVYQAMRRQREKEQALRLCCQTTEQEVYPAGIAVPCLATLPLTVLLLPSLLGFREVWLHHGHCVTCSHDKGARLSFRLRHNYLLALRQAAQIPRFSLTASATPPPSFASRRGEAADYSRRDFLSLLRRESKLTGIRAVNAASDLFAEDRGQDPPPDRLLWEKLLQAFPELLNAGDTLPFAYLEISAACDLCRACTVLCPGQALSVRDEASAVNLIHKPARCYSCGVCARFCPHRAIALYPWQGSDWQERILHRIGAWPATGVSAGT